MIKTWLISASAPICGTDTYYRAYSEVNPELLEFDGEVIKVPNRLGSDHTYRVVIGYTPPRKVDSSMAWKQGYDPYDPCKIEIYKHPFFFFLDVIIVPQRKGVNTNGHG